ncbi:hypothetical protein LIA77_08514 [Sarocladium implicatum]|nr:hypothetical protein LIA77_08514 [Sarocladium implicatum]
MAAATLSAPRYSADDFDTTSIHSAAPSYISEVPSYHSTAHHYDPTPPYSPPSHNTSRNRADSTTQEQPQYGLPPIPPAPSVNRPSLHNFRVPTWSANNAPAARQYRSVIERRAAARPAPSYSRWASLETGAGSSSSVSSASTSADNAVAETATRVPRPLEDPYLVGEQAAAEARRDRLRRENGDEILIREDRQWDWLLAQMETWEQRERSWAKYQREVNERSQRRSLLRSVRGRLRN